jgi:N-acetylglucosaminyl-diphospho-decaprenol L-rhamnosyltransferase
MDLSIVIVTYNSAGVLEGCCASLDQHLREAEVIVVDNASTDETRQLCGELERVTLIAGERNEGFGRACNRGAEAARGSHLLFLNPDVRVTAVDRGGLAALQQESPFGLVAPVLEHGMSGGSMDEHWSRDLLRHVLGPLRPRELPAVGRVVSRRSGWWPAGAVLLVDREEFRRLGGFDPRYFLYYEDIDLARRYRATGLPVRLTQSLRARHEGGTSSSGAQSGSAIRNGWSYLSWIEYICTWDGDRAAQRAAGAARWVGRTVDLALRVLERAAPLAQRVARKRAELSEMRAFISWQCSFGDGTADDGFCPRARRIVGAA